MIKRFVSMLKRMKDWMERFASKPYAMTALFLLALVESSFFPIPPDILLIAIAVSMPKKSFQAGLWCSVGSVAGACIGYAIGYFLMDTLGIKIVEFYNAQEIWAKVVETYQGEVGMWFLAGAAFSPIPFKVATIAAGATLMPFVPFVLILAVGRSARFFLVAGLIYFVGPKVKIYIDKYFDKLSIAFVVLLVLGFVAIKYIF